MPDTLLHSVRFDICLLADAVRIQIVNDEEPHNFAELVNTVLKEYVTENINGLSPTPDLETARKTLINAKIIRRKRKVP